GARYHVAVVVRNTRNEQSPPCWILEFVLPRKKEAPDEIPPKYVLLLSQEDGWPQMLHQGTKDSHSPIQPIDDASILAKVPDGFPLEFFALFGPNKRKFEE